MYGDRSAETLVIETPTGGFNEVSSFPLLFGGVFGTVGGLCLLSALGQGGWVSLVIAVPALALGLGVGRIGLRSARRRHRVELGPARLKISTLGDGSRANAESALREVRVSLKRGRAWEVGLLPRWHDLQREFTALILECGGQRFRLLDGRSEREKQELFETIQVWIDRATGRPSRAR